MVPSDCAGGRLIGLNRETKLGCNMLASRGKNGSLLVMVAKMQFVSDII